MTGELAFVEPVSHAQVMLVVPAGGRLFPQQGEPKIGVAHEHCDQLADISVELDAFFCPACDWSGRVSGAWVIDQLRREGTS